MWLGPFAILRKVNTHAYHVKLPSQLKSRHPVFHMSLLEPVKTSTSPNRHQVPPPPVIIKEDEEWEVSNTGLKSQERKIMVFGGMQRFQSRSEKCTCDPTGNLKNFPELVKDFHSSYPDKPGRNS
ncbi:hypothetical protein O181_063992 [Austropuccinia psidii MF-1]|uniref:Tf2-1-like SH3-like domain-containing protein n=1 Tax=Austropuccinia psidii MF-1 TaxID=1389203 RepID=A0A9Q3I1V9_9BASI|nr:hypothetical protein [Austropuccinia psidii MF-1]